MDDGWKMHDGGNCPVDSKATVIIKLRNGREPGPAPAHHWRWRMWPEGPSDWDIVAWQSQS